MADTNINTFENIAKVEAIAPTTLNGLPGMSSLEIAEITGKNHKHVLRDIAKMLTELELINESKSGPVNAPASDEVKFARAQYRDAKGESRPLTILNKECSGLMKPDTHLGENARQIEVSDDQTTPLLYS